MDDEAESYTWPLPCFRENLRSATVMLLSALMSSIWSNGRVIFAKLFGGENDPVPAAFLCRLMRYIRVT
jgi:hypothetical protein